MTYFTGQPGDVVRDLTAEEYAELEDLLEEFYNDAFAADPLFDTLESGTIVLTGMEFTESGDPQHVFTPFDLEFVFAEGSDVTITDATTKMETLDYQQFILEYLMDEPVNQLDAIFRVTYDTVGADEQ